MSNLQSLDAYYASMDIQASHMPLALTLEYARRWHEATPTAVSHALSRSILTWENPSTLLPESVEELPDVTPDSLTWLKNRHAWFGLPALPPLSAQGLARRADIMRHLAPHATQTEYSTIVHTLLQCAQLARLDPKSWTRAVLTSYPNLATPDMPVANSVTLPWINRYATPILEPAGSIALSCALATCAVYGQYRLEAVPAPDGTLIPIPDSVWDKLNPSDFEPSGF